METAKKSRFQRGSGFGEIDFRLSTAAAEEEEAKTCEEGSGRFGNQLCKIASLGGCNLSSVEPFTWVGRSPFLHEVFSFSDVKKTQVVADLVGNHRSDDFTSGFEGQEIVTDELGDSICTHERQAICSILAGEGEPGDDIDEEHIYDSRDGALRRRTGSSHDVIQVGSWTSIGRVIGRETVVGEAIYVGGRGKKLDINAGLSPEGVNVSLNNCLLSCRSEVGGCCSPFGSGLLNDDRLDLHQMGDGHGRIDDDGCVSNSASYEKGGRPKE